MNLNELKRQKAPVYHIVVFIILLFIIAQRSLFLLFLNVVVERLLPQWFVMYLLTNKEDILTMCVCLFLSVKGLASLSTQ